MPLFSIIHTSARPDKWRRVMDAWFNAAACPPEDIEYVLCVDRGWDFRPDDPELKSADIVVWNEALYKHSGYVSGVNLAAAASHGSILIVVADDQFPCERWDEKLLALPLIQGGTRLGNMIGHLRQEVEGVSVPVPDPEFTIRVSTGTVNEHERRITVMPILSRALYARRGFVFFPQYESMYADNDFCEEMDSTGVTIIDAKHLVFPHHHPLIELETKIARGEVQAIGNQVSLEAWAAHVKGDDDAFKAQHHPEAYEHGLRILGERRATSFAPTFAPARNRVFPSLAPAELVDGYAMPLKDRRRIVIAFPGDTFSKEFLGMAMGLMNWLWASGWVPKPVIMYCSMVMVTRQRILEFVLSLQDKPEYVLWLDHDNLLTPQQLQMLVADLDCNSDKECVSGWYWCDNGDGTFFTSVGIRGQDGSVGYSGGDIGHEAGFVECEWMGFGCVLMRLSCLEKAGDHPFLPILMDKAHHRMSGEDASFCINARERGGVKFWIDPRVNVAHQKRGLIQPLVSSRAPVIVATIRAKNEAANIERCIRSVMPLCNHVIVLDDHSTDKTADKALRCAPQLVALYFSPFSDRDEGRDRQYLLEKARLLHADWIFCVDADEALDPRDVQKLIAACQYGNVDALHLRWMNLWDSEDQIRVDGVYGGSSPPRLWRVTPSLRLHSISNGVHTWSEQEVRRGNADVRLWHWGYKDREQRIARWRWYNEMDPNNEAEDFYRHQIQGDGEVLVGEMLQVPGTHFGEDGRLYTEVPAEAKLLKAGPLKLEIAYLPRELWAREYAARRASGQPGAGTPATEGTGGPKLSTELMDCLTGRGESPFSAYLKCGPEVA